MKYLLDICIILMATKIFSILTKKIRLPQVVGALLAGILLGPAFLNVINSTELLETLSHIGVILLMFTAGMETDIERLKKTFKSSLVIALGGVLVQFATGFFLSRIYGQDMFASVFFGSVLTATSITIAVETLKELGKMKSTTGTVILGASIIDDIISIIILSVLLPMSGGGEVSAGVVFGIVIKMVLFVLFALLCGFIVYKVFVYLSKVSAATHRLSIFALAFCFFMAYAADRFSIADITGAYVAGLILSNTRAASYIETKTSVLSYLFFSPIFFASIGLKISFSAFSVTVGIAFAVLLVLAIFSKVVGCGMGALITKMKFNEALQIGSGMSARGEVALVVADKGLVAGVMNPVLFSAVLLVVIATMIVTPILLKLSFKGE